MKKYLPTILKYSISSLVAIGIFFIVVSIHNIYSETSAKNIMHYLSDGFVVPGILFLGAGFIVMVANMGAFYGVGYALKHLFVMLLPFITKKEETYSQYLKKRKQIHGYLFLFVVGSIFLLAGIIFLIVYSTL